MRYYWTLYWNYCFEACLYRDHSSVLICLCIEEFHGRLGFSSLRHRLWISHITSSCCASEDYSIKWWFLSICPGYRLGNLFLSNSSSSSNWSIGPLSLNLWWKCSPRHHRSQKLTSFSLIFDIKSFLWEDLSRFS